MILTTTTRAIYAAIAEAPAVHQPRFQCDYVDIGDGIFVPGVQFGFLNGSTLTEIIAPPASGTLQRQTKSINIYNADTADIEVTVYFRDDADDYQLYKCILTPGKTLFWAPDGGWVPGGIPGPQGDQGPTGPQGEGITWRGTWNNATEYEPNDTVYYNGSAYISLTTNTNQVPVSQPDDWQLMVSKGDTGAEGPQGIQGEQGEQGLQGEQGPQGDEGPQGDKGLNWKGEWSDATAYAVDDAVEHQGDSYICVQTHSNQEPPNAVYWELLAAGGEGVPVGGTTGQVLVKNSDGDGDVGWADAATGGGGGAAPNYLDNWDGLIDQRRNGQMNSGTNRADNRMTVDRWKILTQSATSRIEQLLHDGDGAACCFRLIQASGTPQRIGMCQMQTQIDRRGINWIGDGQEIVYGGRARPSAAGQSLRCAILAYKSTGTNVWDGVGSDPVLDWTSTTFTQGNFFKTAAQWEVVAVSGAIPLTQNVWNTFQVSGVTPANVNQTATIVWIEGTMAQDETLDISKQVLTRGDSYDPAMWHPARYEESLAQCLPYCQKSFGPFTTPANNSSAGHHGMTSVAANTAQQNHFIPYKVPLALRGWVTGQVTVYNPNANNSNVRNRTRNTDSGTVTITEGDTGFWLNFTGANGWAAGDQLAVNYLIEYEYAQL